MADAWQYGLLYLLNEGFFRDSSCPKNSVHHLVWEITWLLTQYYASCFISNDFICYKCVLVGLVCLLLAWNNSHWLFLPANSPPKKILMHFFTYYSVLSLVGLVHQHFFVYHKILLTFYEFLFFSFSSHVYVPAAIQFGYFLFVQMVHCPIFMLVISQCY